MGINTELSFVEAMQKLDTFINFEREPAKMTSAGFGTERMAALMERLRHPETAQPAVHIAGTKGKGSVANLLAAILKVRGLRYGVYTSPHVTNIRERIVILGKPISEDSFSDAFSQVYAVAEEMRREGCEPSYFEVLTATAFVAFKAAGLQAAVVEVGLGGRLDATNLPEMPVLATGITTISYDHEEILGEKLSAIAGEKAAIIRKRTPVALSVQDKTIAELFKKWCKEKNAPLFSLNTDFTAKHSEKNELNNPADLQRIDLESWRTYHRNVPLAMLGDHQINNAALAFALAEIFFERMNMAPMDTLTLRRAWRGLRLPGRLEICGENPWLIIDAGHNPASVWMAAEVLLQRFSQVKDKTLLFAAAKEKDIQAMLRILAPLMSRIVLTTFNSSRCFNPHEAREFLNQEFPGLRVMLEPDSRKAYALARSETSSEGLLLVTGSFYLAGEIRPLLEASVPIGV